jgi:hypothetical protein
MGKRHIPAFLRQAALLCFNGQNEVALTSKAGKLSLPLINSANEDTYSESIKKYCLDLQLKVDLKGIVRMEIGNDLDHNYYRCIYYGQTSQDSKPNQLIFASVDHKDIEPYTLGVIRGLIERRKICHM